MAAAAVAPAPAPSGVSCSTGGSGAVATAAPTTVALAEIAVLDGPLPRGTLLLQPCDTPGHAFAVPAAAVAALSAQLQGIALAVVEEDVEASGATDGADATSTTTAVLPPEAVVARVLPLSAECADLSTVQLLATWLSRHRDIAPFEAPTPLPSVMTAPTPASLFAPDPWATAFFGECVCPDWDYASHALTVARLHKGAVYLGLQALSRACAALTAFHLRDAASRHPNPMREVASWRPPARAGEFAPPPLASDAALDAALAWTRDAVSGLQPLLRPVPPRAAPSAASGADGST